MKESPANEKTPTKSLKDYVRTVFRHKWKIVLVFMAVMVPVFLHALKLPVSYRSEAKVMVKFGRESVLDRTGSTDLITAVNPQGEINNEVEILTSRELKIRIVESIGPDRILEGVDPGFLARITERITSAMSQDAPTQTGATKNSAAILHLMKHLEIQTIPNSSTIVISYSARSPELARSVVSEMVRFYKKKNIAAHSFPGSYDFYTEVIKRVSKEIDDMKAAVSGDKAELNTLREKYGIDSPGKQREIIWGRISSLNLELERTKTSLASSAEKVAGMEKGLEKVPRTIETSETRGGTVLIGTGGTAVIELPNPVYQEMQVALFTEKAELGALRVRGDSLRDQIKAAQTELRILNENAVQIEELERGIETQEQEIATAEIKYRKFRENLKQAELDKLLEEKEISNITVVQAATIPVEPLSRNRLKLLILALFAGIIASIGTAFAAEFMDHSLKKPRDINEKLQLPALAAIPRVRANKVSPIKRGTRRAKSGSREGPSGKERPAYGIPDKVREHYETLQSRLLSCINSSSTPPRTIAVTSATRGEGVSTVTANLAAFLAQTGGGRVVLVDANLRQPTVHEVFGENLSPGLTDLIREGKVPDEVTRHSPLRFLDIIPAGKCESDLAGTVDSQILAVLVRSLKRDAGYVIIDMPPIKESSSAVRLASLVDGVILVVEAEKIRWEVIERVKEEMLQAKVHLLGVVLNKRRYPIPNILYRRL